MSITSKATALKNRLTDRISHVLSEPARSKARRAKRLADYEVGIIKDNRGLNKRGMSKTPADAKGVTGDRRTRAEYKRIRSKYNR